MKTIIQGKNLRTTYGVNFNQKTIKNNKGEDVIVYTDKPELTKETVIDNWETIAECDEAIEYNDNKNFILYFTGQCANTNQINLSEDESVNVVDKITRVDINAYVLHTDKVLSEEIVDKELSESLLESELKLFNKVMIESNDRLLAYCKLHKLILENTDVYELFKVVYPNQTYKIEDGKFLAVSNSITISSTGITGITLNNCDAIYDSDWGITKSCIVQ